MPAFFQGCCCVGRKAILTSRVRSPGPDMPERTSSKEQPHDVVIPCRSTPYNWSQLPMWKALSCGGWMLQPTRPATDVVT